MNDRERIGKCIAEIRKKKGLSQVGLSELTGIAPGNIARIETGKYSMGVDLLSKIGQALGVELGFDDKFYAGFWCVIQELVYAHRQADIAEEIIRGNGLSIDDCLALQKDSGAFDEVMLPFIESIRQCRELGQY